MGSDMFVSSVFYVHSLGPAPSGCDEDPQGEITECKGRRVSRLDSMIGIDLRGQRRIHALETTDLRRMNRNLDELSST
jgi:hypothetical protein